MEQKDLDDLKKSIANKSQQIYYHIDSAIHDLRIDIFNVGDARHNLVFVKDIFDSLRKEIEKALGTK